MMRGLLLIDKPQGISSFDVIRKLRAKFKEQGAVAPKIGHAGTLDPLASGLLIVLLGDACKQQNRFMKLDKWYEAEITLGASSTTDDAEGDLLSGSDTKVPKDAEVIPAVKQFCGEIKQLPPQFSAKKIGGQRAYKLARDGKHVKLEPKTVTIYEITDISYEYPKLSFKVYVSSGTYIRSLARDIGDKLQTGAYLSGLRRTKIGKFDIKEAISLDSSLETIAQNLVDI